MAAKQYVLYAVANDKNSKKAVYLSRPNLDHVYDPTQLQRRPSWLKGVPTIVHVESKVVYEGTNCLLFMQRRNALLPAVPPLPPLLEISQEEKATQEDDVQPNGVFFLDEIEEKEEKQEEQEEQKQDIMDKEKVQINNSPRQRRLTLEDVSTDTPVQLMPQHQLTPTLLQRPLIPDDQPLMIIRVDL